MDYSTKEQIKHIRGLLRVIGKDDEAIKQDLVSQYSDKRTVSISRMSRQEADRLIAYLNSQVPKATPDAGDRMRKKIIHLARGMGWEKEGKADMGRIRGWCRQFGYLKKDLNDYTVKELPALVTQFEQVYDSYIRRI